MTDDKRFTVEYLEYEPYYIDKKQEYIDTDEKELQFNDLITMSNKQVVECLNHLHKENEFLKIKNERTQEYLRQKDKRITDLIIKKEDAEYELLHLKEKYEELLEEKERYKKEMLYFKRELQKELVCQAFIEGGRR